MTNSKTKVIALIGNPVGHSLSPAMFTEAFKEKKLNFVYLAFRVRDVKTSIQAMCELGFKGLSATIPHKEEVMKYLDSVHPLAKEIGAVNTIVNENGKLSGYNTDVIGAIRALKKKTTIKRKTIVLLGAGGTAKAIGFGLKKEKAKIIVVNRTENKGKNLAKKLGGKFYSFKKLNKEIDSKKLKVDILINCTSIGLDSKKDKLLVSKNVFRKDLVVFDAVYSKVGTKLCNFAKKKKCKVINGLEMLVEQGTEQFFLWTGKRISSRILMKGVLKGLRGN